METDAELERWRGWMLAAAISRTTGTDIGVDYSAEAGAEFSDPDDDFVALVPVRPKNRPPLRSDRIALPEPEG